MYPLLPWHASSPMYIHVLHRSPSERQYAQTINVSRKLYLVLLVMIFAEVCAKGNYTKTSV